MIESIYHLHPKKNWMNDPNGPMFLDGKLHMFYQYNPFGAEWGNMTWAHAVSPDMVHWTRLPHALHPDMPYDKDGVFSGCAVVVDGIPHIIYTGVQPECQCLAIGDKEGMTFTKYEHNPIMPSKGLNGWRDPFVWRAEGEYRMALGAFKKGEGTWIEQYKSCDLIHWERMDDLIHSRDFVDDIMWECPNILLGSGDAMAIVLSAVPSSEMRVVTGHYREGHFTADAMLLYDLGDSFYAPNTVNHPDGRQIQFAWLREQGESTVRAAAGWQGVMSIPREVRLEAGVVRHRPAAEVALLRGALLAEMHQQTVSGCADIGSGFAVELDMTLDAGAKCCLTMLGGVKLHVDGEAGKLRFEFGTASGGKKRTLEAGFATDELLRLQLYLDGTAIELFVNQRESITTRAYPDGSDAALSLCAEGEMTVHALTVYEMNSAY